MPQRVHFPAQAGGKPLATYPFIPYHSTGRFIRAENGPSLEILRQTVTSLLAPALALIWF
jgi:hypothetical protein